ncbi:hypothetical protein MNV49_005211 [Pseudohyphozyma bogoriensis]|nr:hypothetical protein MNV49_005211 [Pseudohyphozyma bogoriensis]
MARLFLRVVFLLSFVFAGLGLLSPDELPVAIEGVYNTTLVIVPVTLEHAQSLLPAAYRSKLLAPDSAAYPALAAGKYPMILELGREKDAGPPGLNVLDFQEAKLEVPNVARLAGSSTPFLYKRIIFVDDYVDVIGSYLQYGLNTTYNSFTPSNSSASASFNYAVDGTVTLYPPYAGPSATGPVTINVEGLHFTSRFEIRGPYACSAWQ